MIVEPLPAVVVTIDVAVVEAEHPLHVVHGAAVPQGPLVQPDHVLGGQAPVPHQLVHGPLVQEPELPREPQPFAGPPWPNGPQPCAPGVQPPAPPKLPGAQGPFVTVAQAEFVVQDEGQLEPPVGECVSVKIWREW